MVRKYRIRAARKDSIRDTLAVRRLHDRTFGKTAPQINPLRGMWWLVLDRGDRPVAFAGVRRANLYRQTGYFSRVGVLPSHRGHGLQYRLMVTMETWCRRQGWKQVVSDTTSNPPSANVFVTRGYKTFTPKRPWSFTNAIYWKKEL